MVHLPHTLFTHILSYKDPRYEKARSGIKTDVARTMPLNVDDELRRLGMGSALVKHCMIKGKMYYKRIEYPCDYGHLQIWRGTALDTIYTGCYVDGQPGGDGEPVRYFNLSSCYYRRPPSELWLQCDACGPDLELYHKR